MPAAAWIQPRSIACLEKRSGIASQAIELETMFVELRYRRS